MGGPNTFKIILYSIMMSNVILFSVASPVEAKKKGDEISSPEVTTVKPITASTAKNLNKEEVQILNNARTEKPATKKREIPDVLADRMDYTDEDFYAAKPASDDNTYQVARPFYETFRSENPDEDSDGREADYRHYVEARRKRMAKTNSRDGYYDTPMRSSGQELIYRQYPLYTEPDLTRYLKGRWMRLNSPTDNLDGDLENDGAFNDRQENYLERLNDPRFQNVAYSPMNGQFMLRRIRRSNLTKPGLYFPVLRRALV